MGLPHTDMSKKKKLRKRIKELENRLETAETEIAVLKSRPVVIRPTIIPAPALPKETPVHPWERWTIWCQTGCTSVNLPKIDRVMA